MSTKKVYTDAEKAIYYKKQAMEAKRLARMADSRKPVRRTGGKQMSTYKGYGEYKKVSSKSGRVPNKSANKNFKSDYGARLGAVVGEGIQSFANALGFGEYNIQQNSCLSHSYLDMGTSPPRVKNTNKGEFTVFNHREYLGDLVTGTGSPSAFTLQQYAINPGNSELFPFAFRMAENFQQWELRGMLVELKSLSSNTSTTLNMGSMFCAIDYNSLDAPPANKVELENLEYACSNKPSDSILMPVECARENSALNTTSLYIAVNSDYQGGDKRLYDIGTLYVGSFGCPASEAPIAELWVTYEIGFAKPHLHIDPPLPPTELDSLGAHFKQVILGSRTEPYWTSTTPGTGNSSVATAGEGYIRIYHRDTPRTYLINAVWRSAAVMAPTIPVITFTGGITPIANFWSSQAINNGQTYSYQATTPQSTTWGFSYVVTVVAGPSTEFDSMFFAGNMPTSPTNVDINYDLTISSLPNTLVNALPPVEDVPQLSIKDNPLFDNYIEEEVKRRVRELKRTTSC